MAKIPNNPLVIKCFPKIIDYYLLRDESQYIADRVRELIKEGWQPIGGMFENSYKDYIQAMVKYEE